MSAKLIHLPPKQSTLFSSFSAKPLLVVDPPNLAAARGSFVLDGVPMRFWGMYDGPQSAFQVCEIAEFTGHDPGRHPAVWLPVSKFDADGQTLCSEIIRCMKVLTKIANSGGEFNAG